MSGMVNPRPYIAPLREREPQTEQPKTMSEQLGKISRNETGPVTIDEQGGVKLRPRLIGEERGAQAEGRMQARPEFFREMRRERGE